jgi:hypothetical protein
MLGIVYHINKVPRYNVLLGLNATQASGREHTIAQKQYIEPWHAELPTFEHDLSEMEKKLASVSLECA